jgi:hypothetical protein
MIEQQSDGIDKYFFDTKELIKQIQDKLILATDKGHYHENLRIVLNSTIYWALYRHILKTVQVPPDHDKFVPFKISGIRTLRINMPPEVLFMISDIKNGRNYDYLCSIEEYPQSYELNKVKKENKALRDNLSKFIDTLELTTDRLNEEQLKNKIIENGLDKADKSFSKRLEYLIRADKNCLRLKRKV